jgi:hypothetical protein
MDNNYYKQIAIAINEKGLFSKEKESNVRCNDPPSVILKT